MKAVEYIDKYKEGLESPEEEVRDKALNDLVLDMANEVKELMEVRHVHKTTSAVSIIKEQNQKWNAIASKIGILKHDGFKELYITKIPEIADLL